MSEEIKQLKILKEKLRNRKMSVLIGAGFSKNVSKHFLSWPELLFDMALELYQSEIEEAYERLLLSKEGSVPEKDQYISKKINYYIGKVGYLEVVSDYIKRKGFREAITTYIEERTPRIIEEGDKLFIEFKLSGESKKVKLEEEMFSQHKLLLRLPWNNIFTTNYDELLEASSDLSTVENIEKEIKEKDYKINEIEKDRDSSITKLKELREKIDESVDSSYIPIKFLDRLKFEIDELLKVESTSELNFDDILDKVNQLTDRNKDNKLQETRSLSETQDNSDANSITSLTDKLRKERIALKGSKKRLAHNERELIQLDIPVILTPYRRY